MQKTIMICDECEEEHDTTTNYYQIQIITLNRRIQVERLDLCKKCGDQKFMNARAKRAAAEVRVS